MQKEISELYNLIKIQNFDKAYSEAKSSAELVSLQFEFFDIEVDSDG